MRAGDGELRAAARAAVDRPGVLRVAFQPIVDTARGVVTGYEALARFAGPPDASPDRWFAAAHAEGVGELLEARALAAALATRTQLPANTFLTVNLGPDALLSEPVGTVLERAGDLRGVVIEITEQQPIADYAPVLERLAPLREAGAMVAVDDAGAGFASLKHITVLRPDLVKLDRGLVAGIDADPTRAAVVETMGIFASRLDAWLLAEGVETAGELRRLLELGVPLVQGYLLARPGFAMGGAEDHALAMCRERTRLQSGGGLAALVEDAVIVAVGSTDAHVAEAFLETGGRDWLVTVDEFRRPVELVARHGLARVPALSVMEADGVPDVVRRALLRPPAARFAPIALCGETGALRGLIPVERLLERLADAAEGSAAA
jgi:EAL domain-containing protein (putative c-di-GMP-specific phosphodiesterase class I)